MVVPRANDGGDAPPVFVDPGFLGLFGSRRGINDLEHISLTHSLGWAGQHHVHGGAWEVTLSGFHIGFHTVLEVKREDFGLEFRPFGNAGKGSFFVFDCEQMPVQLALGFKRARFALVSTAWALGGLTVLAGGGLVFGDDLRVSEGLKPGFGFSCVKDLGSAHAASE